MTLLQCDDIHSVCRTEETSKLVLRYFLIDIFITDTFKEIYILGRRNAALIKCFIYLIQTLDTYSTDMNLA
jgi:hypothetical protein